MSQTASKSRRRRSAPDPWLACACAAAIALSGCAATAERDAPFAPETPAVAAAPRTPQGAPIAELTETYWRPVEIDGRTLVIHAGTREPHIVLRGDGARVTGFTGCNKLAGSYRRDGSGLSFGPLITTRMACVGDAGNALEADFVKALQAIASYRVVGEALELRDAAGATRIRFEARYLK